MTVITNVKKTEAQIKQIEALFRELMHYTNKEEDYLFYQKSLKEIETIKVKIAERIKKLEWEEPQYKGM
ncbi:MAG TPA: hypothetical protein VLA13_02570 [Massilibacterium sp.]|nr:hypothetical protein [Massilibacterium sp.]